MKLFKEWEKRKDYAKFPELHICSDGSGRMVDGKREPIFSFYNIDELLIFLKEE